MDQPSPTTTAAASPCAPAPPTQQRDTSVEKFERLYRQLDSRGQKMVAVYMHLLVYDPEFQKMPVKERCALLERWFEERPAPDGAS